MIRERHSRSVTPRASSMSRRAERPPGQREQVVHDRYLDLTHDRQVMLHQQVEVPVNAAADRVLNRQHSVVGRAGVDDVEDIFEALAGQQLGFRVDQPRRGFAEGSRFSLVGNPHGRARFLPIRLLFPICWRTSKRAISLVG